ncbi:MAG: type II toxin-antitoxin system RelE/ParE family toxin [Ignavibacteriae bacterium]|nr:type II toxin-antitoxin system RelE/ParE family toxin [Ignavibacteriota bacterium]
MKRVFVSDNKFWKLWVDSGLEDDDLKEVEDVLIKNPDLGDVIKSTGGLRKLRWGAKGMGKSGGIRILYVDFPKYEQLFFITLLRKSEVADLSSDLKKAIAKLIKDIENKLEEKLNEKHKNKK